ncbi:MAG: hypothetical protein V2A75_05050 [Pseudomonadota bacterium]
MTITLSEIISGIGTVGGLYIAYQGLTTWKKQLKGQVEYELSRRVVASLLKHKDAISAFRYPAMFVYEMPEPPHDEKKCNNDEENRFYGKSKAYEARWEKVQDASTNLKTDLLEAEAIWGEEFIALFKQIFVLEHELFIIARNHLLLINPSTSQETKQAIQEIIRKKRDILYDDLSDDGDEFKNELNTEIKKVKEYLKPKLVH